MSADFASRIKTMASLLALLGLMAGCTAVQTEKMGSDGYDIYAIGFGDTKARVIQEANSKCGDRNVVIEEEKCGSLCTEGKVTCGAGGAKLTLNP